MNNFRFKTIRKETLRCLYRDDRDKKYKNHRYITGVYYLLPFLLAFILVLFEFFLTNDSINYFITGISIFAGLFFNLLIVVSDKMIKRKELLNSVYQASQDYANRYKLMSERLIAAISYAILLSVLIIGLMFMSQVDYKIFGVFMKPETVLTINLVSDYFFNFVSYYFGFQFVCILLLILSKIYEILIHEMNTKPYQESSEGEN